jgi:putative peptidoglycan lipid II flippase
VNIALAFPLYAWLGIPGLALAFSLAYFVGCALTLFVLHRDLHGIDGHRLAATGVRVVVAATVVGLVAWGSAELIGWSSTVDAIIATVLGAVAGALVYLGLLVLLRVDEVKLLAALLPRRAAASPRV